MEATLNNTPLQKQLPACQLLLNRPLGWVKGTLSAPCNKEEQSSDFHHEKSNMLCTLPLESRVTAVTTEIALRGYWPNASFLQTHTVWRYCWLGGWRVRLSPRTCDGQSLLTCLLYFKWQLCIFRANKWGGESKGSTTQTDRAHISLVCPLRMWRWSRRLPLKHQAVMPSCSPQLHLCASPITMALTVTFFGPSKDFGIPAPPKKIISVIY